MGNRVHLLYFFTAPSKVATSTYNPICYTALFSLRFYRLFYNFFLSLFFHISTYDLLIPMFTHRCYVIAICPEFSSPQFFLHLWTFREHLPGYDALHYLDDFFGLYAGTDWIRKCTWSLSVPTSKNLISYLS